MKEFPLEALNGVVGACLEALRRIAPEPAPCPVKLWVRERFSTVLPVVVSQRFNGLDAWINVSMDLNTALDIAGRVLKEMGAYAAGFSEPEQEALRYAFSEVAAAVTRAAERGASVSASPARVSFGQRIQTAAPYCPRPLSTSIRFAGGRIEVDVAAGPQVRREEEESREDALSGLPV